MLRHQPIIVIPPWMRRMRFGFFDQLPCPPGFTEQQRYNDILAQIELGDRVGFDTVWLGELHFSRGFSTLADPKREYGMDEFICYFNQGGLMPPATVRDSMTRFATE